MAVPNTEATLSGLGEGRQSAVKLSVTIVAQNEERTIGPVLEAVQGLADEVIFVDSGSTDKTIEIAQSYGVRFFHQDWLGYGPQKNFAIDQASGDWILSLDADEILTREVVAEIKAVLAGDVPDNVAGFKIPRVLYIGERSFPYGGFYPDAQLRLFRKGRGRWKHRIVHESVEVQGETITLKNDMLHYAYKDVEQFAQAMDKYARMSAQHYLSKGDTGWRAHPVNEIFHPLWTLFFRYFLRKGYLGGAMCWRVNLIYADYVRKKIRYLREALAESNRPRN